jgi:hypothetical protein
LAGGGFGRDKAGGAKRYTSAGRESLRFTWTGLTPFALAWGRRQYAGKTVD